MMMMMTLLSWSIAAMYFFAVRGWLQHHLRYDLQYVMPCSGSKRSLLGDGFGSQGEQLRFPGFSTCLPITRVSISTQAD
jgi:hypothetical protein